MKFLAYMIVVHSFSESVDYDDDDVDDKKCDSHNDSNHFYVGMKLEAESTKQHLSVIQLTLLLN